jgi:hypothetical protein
LYVSIFHPSNNNNDLFEIILNVYGLKYFFKKNIRTILKQMAKVENQIYNLIGMATRRGGAESRVHPSG